MDHQAIAEKISQRMHQLINLPAALAEIEKLRLIGVGITQQVQETEAHIEDQRLLLEELLQKQAENSASLFAATQDVDDLFAALYRPVDAPAAIVQELAKKARGKKVKEAAPETVTEPPTEKHPCHLCEDVFYSKGSLVKHLRAEHKVLLEEAVNSPISSICADCVGDCEAYGTPHTPHTNMTACTGYSNELSEDQVKWRDSTCNEWRGCQFQLKCFGPANEEDPTCFKEDEIRRLGEAALAKSSITPSIPNVTIDQVGSDADGVPTVCINTDCSMYDADDPNGCAECANVWECEDVIGLPAAQEETPEVVPTVYLPAKVFAEKGVLRKAFKGNAGIPDSGKLENVFETMGKLFAITGAMYRGTGMEKAWAYEMIPVAFWDGGDTCTVKQRGAKYSEDLHAGKGGTLKQTGCQVTWKKEPYILGQEIIFEPETSPTPAPSNEEAKQEVAQTVGEAPAQASEIAQQVHPEDCDVCGNRGHLDDDSYCLCAHGRNRRQWDQEELERRKARKGELNAATQTEAATENHQAEPDSAEPSVCADPAEQITSFTPLDEPAGDCELCMGYGVVEGETALVTCTCEAGLKVKGGVLPSCCDNCDIEDPDCASCHLPDMEAPFEVEGAEPVELEKCANGSCTATGKQPKETCLRVGQLGRAPQDCKNFVPVEKCTHHMLKRSTRDDGSVRCDLCEFILRPAGSVDPATGKSIPQGGAAQPSAFQQKCPHPKPFREETPDGVICKVCKLNLTQPALFA